MNEKGFTLLQTILAMMILAMITIPVIYAFNMSYTLFLKGNSKTNLINDIHEIEAMIEDDMAYRSTFLVSDGGLTLTITWPDATEVIYSVVDDQLQKDGTSVMDNISTCVFDTTDVSLNINIKLDDGLNTYESNIRIPTKSSKWDYDRMTE